MKRILLTLVALAAFLSPVQADDKSDWDVLERASALPKDRTAAAKSIAKRAKSENGCEKVVARMIPIALEEDTYPETKLGIVQAIHSCDCDGVRKLVAKKIGHGKADERAWILQVARGLAGPEIDKAVLEKSLVDDKIENRLDAAAILVQHQSADARSAFEAILKAGKDAELLGPIVSHLATLYDGTSDWAVFEDRMLALVSDKNESLRRAALAAVARGKNPARIDLFTAQMSNPDWSTRAIALEYLVKTRTKQGLAAILTQFANEPKGTRMNAECVTALMRLTGMNFADRAADWAAWWQKNEAAFEFPSAVSAPSTGERPRRDSDTKVVQFYGIEVDSKRVCFVVDISGSMKEEMKEGENQGRSRFEVAKEELGKIIDGLAPGTLFNIVTFSSDVEAWLDEVGDLPVGLGGKKPEDKRAPATGAAPAAVPTPVDEKQKLKDAEAQKKFDDLLRSKAHKYVEKLEAVGGTNIHDALERAFEDTQLDTIFFLTDGEPSFGREVDPVKIREIVQRWNVTRRIKICAISIGTDMDLLKNLAADSGGEYRFFK
ncbi:MAG: hypothetical protein SGI72_14925 [Planctomycetota bacterium]|nr:hypothetical protein [Planctomycetota bacterium]